MKVENPTTPPPFRPFHFPTLDRFDRHGFPKTPQAPLPLHFLASVHIVATQNMLAQKDKQQ